MKPTNEHRNERFRSASETARQLYSSEESGNTLRSIFEKNNIEEAKYKPYALAVGDVILGFYPKTELAQHIQEDVGLDQPSTETIMADLQEFLAPLEKSGNQPVGTEELQPAEPSTTIQPSPAKPVQSQEQTEQNVDDTIPLRNPAEQPVAPPEPQQKQAPPAPSPKPVSLTPSRTMGDDMKRAKAGSGEEQQNSVPRFSKPLTDTPRYEK